MAAQPMTGQAFFVLTALADGPRHGYGIVGEVAELSGGRVKLKIGSLHRALLPADQGRAGRAGGGGRASCRDRPGGRSGDAAGGRRLQLGAWPAQCSRADRHGV
jgi:Transcriptional regulator PadR-like family